MEKYDQEQLQENEVFINSKGEITRPSREESSEKQIKDYSTDHAKHQPKPREQAMANFFASSIVGIGQLVKSIFQTVFSMLSSLAS